MGHVNFLGIKQIEFIRDWYFFGSQPKVGD